MEYRQIAATGGIALLIALPLFASAATFHAGDQVSLTGEEAIADDVYATGGMVMSNARITGDLYAGGGTVTVSGPVTGDVVIGGGTVMVLGTVGDDVRAGGGNVMIKGTVQGDVLIGGGQVQLAGERIGGDVLIGGGAVRIDAPIAKDLRVGGGEVYINASIAGSVEADADRITLGPNARIAGDFTYRSTHEAAVEEGAVVTGATHFEPREDRMPGPGFFTAVFSAVALVFLLMLTIGAFIFALVFKRYAKEVVENSFAAPFLELGRGLLVLIAMPVISVLLLISVVGMPLGVLGLLAYVFLLIVSWFMAPVLMGSLIYQWIYKGPYLINWKTVLLGIAVFFVIGIVPVIGGLVQFGFMLLSLGSIARLKWHIAKTWR